MVSITTRLNKAMSQKITVPDRAAVVQIVPYYAHTASGGCQQVIRALHRQTDQISTQQVGIQHQKGRQLARPRQRRNQGLRAIHDRGRPYSDVVLMPESLDLCL